MPTLQSAFPHVGLWSLPQGADILTWLAEQQADLVLVDQRNGEKQPLLLPGLIKATHPHLPVVMLIDLANEELAAEALGVGVDGYLFKTPKVLTHLARTLIEVLARTEKLEQLHSSDEKLRLIFENAFDGISIYEEVLAHGGRRLLDCNERYAEMAGRSRAELLALGNTSLVQRKVSRVFSQLENKLIRQEQRRYRGIFSWMRPDGKENVIEYSAAPIDLGGRPLTIGIDRDITEQMQTQQVIQRRAAHLSALNAVIGVGAAVHNLPDLLRRAAEELCRALPSEQAIVWLGDMTAAWGVSPSAAAAKRQEIGAYVPGTEPVIHMLGDGDGGVQEWWLVAPIAHEGERMGGLLVRGWEINDWSPEAEVLGEALGQEIGAAATRLRLLASVEAQARQMQLLVDVTPQAIVLLDNEGRILLFNPAANTVFEPLGGLTQGHTLDELGLSLVEDFPRGTSAPAVQEVELAIEPRQIFEVTARSVDLAHPESGWLLIVRNITLDRERQQRREQQARLAAVGQLAAGIAHDFNNLLASVLLLVQLTVQDQTLSGQGRTYLHKAIEQVEHGAALIRQILDFGRRSVLNRSRRNFPLFLEETADLLRRVLGDGVIIRVAYPPQEIVLEADFTLMQQACLNLALNARDAMPQGGVLLFSLQQLTVAVDEPSPEGLTAGEWLCLTVSDTGQGIPAEVLPHIFEPFFTTKEVGQGSGLGLAQVYGIVQQHQGEMRAESRPGQGSRFLIYLPALTQREISIPAPHEPVSNTPQALFAQCILVVEDQPALREALCDILDLHGYTTESAASGTQAIELFAKEPERFALVLSDMSMPGMGGLEMHSVLCEHDRRVRTLILSGYPIHAHPKDWDEKGIVGWLQKPVNSEELVSKIQAVLADDRD